MKKSLILSAFLFANVANADLLDDITGTIDKVGGIIDYGLDYWKTAKSYYEKYFDKLDNLTGGIVSKCYNIPQPDDLSVCQYIPDPDDIGLNVCKYLPGASGVDNRTLRLRELKRNLCSGDKASGSIHQAGREFEIYKSDKIGGNSSGTNKNKVISNKEAYGDMASEVLVENTLINTAFMSQNQKVLNELLLLYRSQDTQKGSKKKELSEMTFEDLVNSLPKDIEEYTATVDTYAEIVNLNKDTQTPTALSNHLETAYSTKNLDGESAKSYTSDYLAQMQSKVDSNLEAQIGFAINTSRSENDVANPTQEMVNLMRSDLRPTEVAKIKEQMRREGKIRADITMAAEQKKNIMELVAKKSLIMNEKFDRDEARKAIEAMLQ